MAGSSAAGDRLDRRALNRATLARQLLLDRVELPVAETVGRLAGLNAQDVEPPYLTLWARLADFERDALTRALDDRAVVRGTLLRGTQHLVTADDYLAWRPLLQPVMDRLGRGALGRAGVDREALAAAARRHLDGRRLTRRELARLLAQDWPGHPPGELAWSVSTCCRWSTRHPAASGGVGARSRWSWPRPGWGARRLPGRRRAWSCGTWPPSGRPRSPTSRPGPASPGCASRPSGWAGGCAASATSAAGSCSTCPTPPGPTPGSPARCGSCPRSTTCCWPTPTAAG